MLPKSGPPFLSKPSSPRLAQSLPLPKVVLSPVKASLSALPLSTDHGQHAFVVAHIISDLLGLDPSWGGRGEGMSLPHPAGSSLGWV